MSAETGVEARGVYERTLRGSQVQAPRNPMLHAGDSSARNQCLGSGRIPNDHKSTIPVR